MHVQKARHTQRGCKTSARLPSLACSLTWALCRCYAGTAQTCQTRRPRVWPPGLNLPLQSQQVPTLRVSRRKWPLLTTTKECAQKRRNTEGMTIQKSWSSVSLGIKWMQIGCLWNGWHWAALLQLRGHYQIHAVLTEFISTLSEITVLPEMMDFLLKGCPLLYYCIY